MKNKVRLKSIIAKILFAIMMLTNMSPVYAAEVTDTGIVTEDDSTEATITDAVTEVAPLEEDGGIISEGGFLEEASDRVDSGTYNHAHDIELVRAMTNRETYINVKGWGITTSNYSTIMKGIINTNPQLFYVDYNNIRYTYIGSDVIKLTVAYFYSKSTIQTMQSQISDAVSKIDSEVDTAGMNDLEIALAYHDYLATHIAYDSDGLASGSAPKTDYNIYGAFVNGKAVCQGYAEAMQYLLMRKDIICGIATSKNANHAWNVILYNGRWYHIDVTWDDPTRDNLGRVNHDFFMITDTTLLADDAKKSDYVVIVPYGYTYKKAVDTTYEKGFWSGIGTQMYPYKGNWYFLEPVEVGTSNLGKTIYGFQIVKYNYALKSKTVLVEPTKAIWYTGSSTFYVSNHSRVAAKNGLLYFSMPKSIMCYNIETGKTDNIVALSADFEKNENIYGLGFIKDSLCVVIKTSAPSQNDTTNETYYKVSYVGTRPIEGNPINDLPNVTVRYTTHVQTYGWQGVENNPDTWFKNGQMAGTSGKAKRLEGIRIRVDGNSNLGIQYMTHCQSYGWLPWSANGEMNGTEGEAKRLEAIRIALTGADKDNYDVYYRVHAQSYGWLGWAKNGEPAGSSGLAKRLEGIQVVVVKKGAPAPGFNYGGIDASFAPYTHNAYMYKSGTIPTRTAPGGMTPNVSYRTHVQSYGWQGWKYNGQMSGTSGKAKRLEGINIRLTNQQYSGNIVYTTHVQTYGWQGNINNPDTWKKNGEMSGTSGQAKRLEAIKIALTGEMEQHYDIYYRVHAQSYGWLGWAKNGESAGTQGGAKRLEGIQIVLVEKGGKAPANNYGGIVSNSTRTFVTVVGK